MQSPADFPLKPWQRLIAAIVAGIVLRFAVGMQPLWWLAWVAPTPLLVLAYRSPARHAAWSTLLATLIAASAYAQFFFNVIPIPALALLPMLGMAVSWSLIVLGARHIVLHYRAWWTALAFPALWAGADTLMAAALPDGNWGSYGYSQSDNLPIMQLAALLGVSGLVFVVTLLASALALMLAFGRSMPHLRRLSALNAVVLIGATAFGLARLQAPVEGPQTSFGLVAIDDYIGGKTPAAASAAIWQQYDRHIETLAAQGAQVIVLPEKIAVVAPAESARLQQHFAGLAARLKVWITVGIGVDTQGHRVNLAWLFSPQGRLDANYQKHHLAPPEREFEPSSEYAVRSIGPSTFGLAICKDMHFAAMGRAYGQRGASAMLVPAWDFQVDGPLAAKMTATRGIENGFSVVRASREGWLSVSDPYGRIVARENSAFMPGKTLLYRAKLPAAAPTPYTSIGDAFGWLCGAGALVLLLLSLRRKA